MEDERRETGGDASSSLEIRIAGPGPVGPARDSGTAGRRGARRRPRDSGSPKYRRKPRIAPDRGVIPRDGAGSAGPAHDGHELGPGLGAGLEGPPDGRG